MDRRKIESFEDLIVWQKGIELVKEIYLHTGDGDFKKDYALRDQIRRAAVSIPTNIAEGFERASRKEYLLFLNIAEGSAGEVRSLLRVAFEVGYLNQANYERLGGEVTVLSRRLYSQIKSLKEKETTGAKRT